MLSGDERLIVGSTELFGSDDLLASRLAEVLAELRIAVDATDDDAVLSSDAEQWARRLADARRIDPPRVEVAAAELELERPDADFDAASRSKTDLGFDAGDGATAATYRLRISVPVTGEIELLRARPSVGATPLRGDLEPGHVIREWLWPAERGAQTFDGELETFTARVADGARQLAREVDSFNAVLPERARAAIDERRMAILSEREFVGALSLPVKRARDPRSSIHGRLLARVAKWQAPPRNLLLSALVLLVLPWDDVLIDVLYAGDPKAPALGVYVIWILFDVSLIWVVLAGGRMVRPAFVYGGIAAGLDVVLGVVYYSLTEYGTAYMVITALVQIAYLALITTVMWVRLKGPVPQDRWQGRWLGFGHPLDTAQARRRPRLFVFVVPLIVSIAVAYAAAYAASLTCATGASHHGCSSYGPPIGLSFFDESAHIIAILLIALAIEARLLVAGRRPEERSLVAVTALGLAVGIAASLTAAAAHSETLPLTFWLTVQALALGLTTLLMLPFLGEPPSSGQHEP